MPAWMHENCMCGKCMADFNRRYDERNARILPDIAKNPPSYAQGSKNPPSYAAVEKEKWFEEQMQIMRDDMKKHCHQIVGESQNEFGMRRCRWRQAIARKRHDLGEEYKQMMKAKRAAAEASAEAGVAAKE